MGRSLDSYLDDASGGGLALLGAGGAEIGVKKRRKFRDPKSMEEWLANLGPRARGTEVEQGADGDDHRRDGSFGYRGESMRGRPGSKVYGALRNAMWWMCLTFLLPRGYPDSVAKGYAEFMVWNSLRYFRCVSPAAQGCSGHHKCQADPHHCCGSCRFVGICSPTRSQCSAHSACWFRSE